MTTPTRPHGLSKSRFVAGCQCHKLLWWKVHEPKAEELQPDIVLQDRFDQGQQVGEMARDRFPGGVLIDFPHREVDARIAATKAPSTTAPPPPPPPPPRPSSRRASWPTTCSWRRFQRLLR